MCYETDNAVKSGTADESKISYNIVQDDDDIYPVKEEPDEIWIISNNSKVSSTIAQNIVILCIFK